MERLPAPDSMFAKSYTEAEQTRMQLSTRFDQELNESSNERPSLVTQVAQAITTAVRDCQKISQSILGL